MKIYTVHLNSFNYFTILKKGKYLLVIISNDSYFLNFLLNNYETDVYIDDFTKSISVNTLKNLFKQNSLKNLNFELKNFFFTFFFKIKFVGKGFRIQSFRNKKLMNFTFGHSHKMYMHLPLTFFKRISKQKYFFKMKRIELKNYLINKFKEVKPINKYTLRGLRITRTIITKRKGRKSPTL